MINILINFALLSSFIGFVAYLFIIIVSFFGCCVGMDNLLYHKIITFIISIGAIILGVCMYNNCKRSIT